MAIENAEAPINDEARNAGLPAADRTDVPPLPAVVDRATWQAQLDDLLVREKAHTREGDAIHTRAISATAVTRISVRFTAVERITVAI